MVLTPRLELRQGQTLVMTPQLQQAIKLLQLSNIELTAYVEEELEQNPLLERDDDEGNEDRNPKPEEKSAVEGEGADNSDSASGEVDGGEAADTSLETMDLNATGEDTDGAEVDLDVDYDNQWNNDSVSDSGGNGLGEEAFANWSSRGGGFDEMSPDLEGTLSETVSLRDHLNGQLSIEIADPAERIIGMHLIDMLDESGYIAGDLEQLADILGCGLAEIEAVLEILQQFDPPGIFARDLAECLGLQLREMNRLDPAMQALLENLDLLAKRDLKALIRICGVDEEDVTDMVAEIRALDPKPALAFDYAPAQPVTPDILMRPKPGGGWVIELNSDTLPRVLVNNQYYAEINQNSRNKEDKQYINNCLQTANWLVKSLHQRATTILKVAGEIVRQQELFFTKGVQYLRPLVLRDIAEVIDMHESTVSRVTSNKYVATPRGIYELKYFFTTAINSSSGGASHSAESVRHRIRELIDGEPVSKILSDDRIVEILKGDSIDIARRTVAKYREAMGIPSSVQRRREKKSSL